VTIAPKVSFEFFPPKSDEGEKKLWDVIKRLEQLAPQFVSVTYGAGGSTRDKTREIVGRIDKETSLSPAAHLTCVEATKEEIDEIVQGYWDDGVRRIVALRGDPPGMEGKYEPYPGGYPYAHELVKAIKRVGDFKVYIAAFPEVHPEAVSAEADIDYLKEKIDAGATAAITQYCFDTDVLLRFIDKLRKKNVTVPIIPGIMVINNFQQIVNFSERCGASVPGWLHESFKGTESGPEKSKSVAVDVAAEQCKLLMKEGVDQFHFYTLNSADITAEVCGLLGVGL